MVNVAPLNPELQKIANEELGEVATRISEDLNALREWIKHQPHLKPRQDDQFLIQFLRGCKYSLEKAKDKLDLHFSLKTKYPEMLNVTNVDEPKFREVHNLGCFLELPIPINGCGPRIVVFRFNYPTNKYSIDDIFQPGCAVHELMLLKDPYACICGLSYIVDFGLATASHYMQMTPNFCKKMVSFLEKSMPYRIKSVYYINVTPAAQQFFKILFPFLSEKLRQRIKVLGQDMQELYQYIAPKYLPKDYGGELASLSELAADYNKVWDAHRDFFKENANCGSDESLRPGKPLDIDGLFGVGGSFRKIVVD
ncbi:clavesin-2 [Stomoxys calcitrans]|uniref:clavesin-2 n=1 Tax=Stomoxys calcitrans TaxID=35570 RepID=UPI0027E293D1|nr:clavesin-2 [Stomoxys calcitrans]